MNFNNINTIEELLSYQGKQFIQMAYKSLLGREADPDGLNYYLKRMESGINKVGILMQLRESQESKSKIVNILGLEEAIRDYKYRKIPLYGSFLKLIHFGAKEKSSSSFKSKQTFVEHLKNTHVSEIDFIPESLTLEILHSLNPEEQFLDMDQAISALINQPPIRKLRIHEKDEINADFYATLALKHEESGDNSKASELYKLSLLFASTAKAHENLGNFAKEDSQYNKALLHYQKALELDSKSEWIYINSALIYGLIGNKSKAIDILTDGILKYPASELLLSNLDSIINDYWHLEEQHIEFLATIQERERLIEKYDEVTTVISEAYTKIFMRCSDIPLKVSLNKNRVLIISLTDDVLPQCYRYRIEQKIEQLEYAGYEAETVAWHENEKALDLINFYDLVIFYRVPAFPGVLKLVEYAKSLGKITFFEVDDLLFEANSVPPIETYGGQVSLLAYINVTKDIGTYRSIAKRCDYAIASTLPLLDRLAPLVKTKIGFLHRNGLDKYNNFIENKSVRHKEHITIFYGSGTLAHNSDFIVEALPAIIRILKEHKNVKLAIMGYLTLPDGFMEEFRDRLIQIPFVKDVSVYYSYLSGADINLAVLHDDELTACKSELKWFEAATFSIPSIVSRTQNYLDVIHEGVDGFVVKGENAWYDTLKKLVVDSELRDKIGKNAFNRIFSEYTIPNLAKNINLFLNKTINIEVKNKKQKIALVNIFFPPNARGGATRVVVDEFSVLQEKYGDEFELVIFTANTNSSNYYSLNSYLYNGIRVYCVTVPLTESTNKLEFDPKIAEQFNEFLKFEKPDLIHFHCIQALTASMVEATQKRNIPHLITVHDAWWISDYQFLIDEKGNVYPEGHPDPFKPFTLLDGITLEQSIKRRNYLKELLNNSNGVLAVSDTFRKIYEKNGISNVITNKNGISDDIEWRNKDTSHTDKVICAHIGGMSPHKGFDIFKQAILSLHASRIEILIVDHSKSENYCAKTRFGNMDVTILGHVNQNKIADIYRQIDVLFAPSTCPESFGLVTREATACGCWVVASDLGGIGEDVTPENGFIITPTKENISKVFHEIDKNPKKYKELSKSLHIRRSSEQVEEIVSIFKTILKESKIIGQVND